MIVSNIGVDPGFSAIYTTNAAMHTAFVQVDLKPGHKIGSYEYIDAGARRACEQEMPELATFFSSGSLVDAVLNMGMQAPIDVQVAGTNMKASYQMALDLARADPRRFAAWPTSTSRRIWIIPRCAWISIACAPANWD